VNGAQTLIETLVDNGVRVCFTNPGTSEMHFVAALDTVPEMRAILALFEGVATGAADGYARMSERPGATLLHLGSGLGNGLANLHNARKGKVPIVNIVGDHATYHTKYDAQLQSDIETVARNCSGWVRTSQSTEALAGDAAEAIVAAQGPPGQVATLILPADVSWSAGAQSVTPSPPAQPPVASAETVETVASALRGRGDGARPCTRGRAGAAGRQGRARLRHVVDACADAGSGAAAAPVGCLARDRRRRHTSGAVDHVPLSRAGGHGSNRAAVRRQRAVRATAVAARPRFGGRRCSKRSRGPLRRSR